MNYFLTSTLQDELVKELAKVFKGVLLKTVDGFHEPKVYPQRLPISNSDDDDEIGYAPYIIVMLSDFKIEHWHGDKQITVVLVLCTYDGGEERRGDKDCQIMIDKILERFGKNPHLGGFSLEMPIEGAWQEKDTYPFFYAALELKFSSIKVETEDYLA